MSQHCIDYEDYKKLIQKNSTSPRRNLFEENRALSQQVKELQEANEGLREQMHSYKHACYSIVDAIARVYSPEVAEELVAIIATGPQAADKLGDTIYQLMALHQSNPTVSDWSHPRSVCTPEKSHSSYPHSARSDAHSSSPYSRPGL